MRNRLPTVYSQVGTQVNRGNDLAKRSFKSLSKNEDNAVEKNAETDAGISIVG